MINGVIAFGLNVISKKQSYKITSYYYSKGLQSAKLRRSLNFTKIPLGDHQH